MCLLVVSINRKCSIVARDCVSERTAKVLGEASIYVPTWCNVIVFLFPLVNRINNALELLLMQEFEYGIQFIVEM